MAIEASTRQIELVVSDVDGTLITSNGDLSHETAWAIRRVMDQGVHFCIASGRATRRVREVMEGIDLVLPVISSNGAMIEDLNTGEVMHSLYMDQEVAEQVLSAALRHDVRWVFCDVPEMWIYQRGPTATPDQVEQMRGQSRLWVDDIVGYIRERNPEILKIVVNGEESELERLEVELWRIEGAHVTSSWTGNREIIVAGADKASAAKKLVASRNISPENVLALGDNRNDLELLEWAGIGVAMGNAIPELKEIADWVTATNDEDGVARALERFIPDKVAAL